MNIRVVGYTASFSPIVQAFVNLEIDGWLRFNGLNFMSDGTLNPAQLTPQRKPGKRIYIDAVQVIDPDLAQLVAADILKAIGAHVALLRAERRSKPPVEWKPEPQKVDPKKVEPKAAAAAAAPERKPLPPPVRLARRRKPDPQRKA
jgi:hypothetical protein